jgi:cobalt-zinc-cadmium efflux system outer membrane protein
MVRAILLGFLIYSTGFRLPVAGMEVPEVQERPADTDTLVVTVDEARSLALAQNPAFLGALERVTAAQGDLQGARTYPLNPEIEMESPGYVTRGGLDSYEFRLGQEIEWAGQRGLRISAARSGLSAATSRLLDDARQLLAEVETAFITLNAAERRLALAEEIAALNDRLLDAVRTQLQEGEVSILQANLAEIEAARSRARVLSSNRDVSSASLSLGRQLGLSSDAVLKTSEDDLPSLDTGALGPEKDQLLVSAMGTRPDLAASLWEVERTSSLRSLASRELIPNLTVGAIADRGVGDQDPGYGLFLGVSLPVFQRNQGLRIRREAEFREASMEALDRELQVRQEIADALQSLDKASQELQVFEEDVLEPARQNQALLDTAYTEGKLDLSSLLLLRNQLLDAEMEYWEAWERRQGALVDLRNASAAILDGVAEGIQERIR